MTKDVPKKLSFLQEAILLLLSEQWLYGLEIQAALVDCTNEVCAPTFGTLYPALNGLAEAGLLELREEVVMDPPKQASAFFKIERQFRTRRTFYTTTEAGQQALHQQENYRVRLRRFKTAKGK